MLNEILHGCRKRQRESQKALYKEFYAYGMSIALRYAGSREEAVTILNDAFLNVFEHIKSYDMNRPFKPWFRRILINTAINQFHKQNREPDWMQWEPGMEASSHPERITSAISYQEIIAMVQTLSPAYRTVFNLHVIEGYTHKEIANRLGISEGTSKSNLFKAKRELQIILEKNLTG